MKKLTALTNTSQMLFPISSLPLNQGADSFWFLTAQGYLYSADGDHSKDFNTAQQLCDALNAVGNKSKVNWVLYTDPATSIDYLAAIMKAGDNVQEINLYASELPAPQILGGTMSGGSQVALQYSPNWALMNHKGLNGHMFTLNGNPITPDGLFENPYNNYFGGTWPYRIVFNFTGIAFKYSDQILYSYVTQQITKDHVYNPATGLWMATFGDANMKQLMPINNLLIDMQPLASA